MPPAEIDLTLYMSLKRVNRLSGEQKACQIAASGGRLVKYQTMEPALRRCRREHCGHERELSKTYVDQSLVVVVALKSI